MFLIALVLILKFLVIFWSQKLAPTYYQYLEFAVAAHFNCSFPLHFSTQNENMCHGTIGSSLIEIQSQINQKSIPTISKI